MGATKSQRNMRGYWPALVLALAMLLASLGTSIANIALPVLSRDLSAPFQAVQWVIIAYLAALTICAVLVGRLGDRYGLKPMLLVGLGLFTTGSLFCGLAVDLGMLVGARMLQGVGAAFLMTLTMALVRETAEENRMGRALGLLGTMSALGTALGPAVGGLLISTTGWRGVFLVLVPLGLLTLLLAARILPAGTGGAGAAPERVGSLPGTGLRLGLLSNFLVAAVMMTTLVVGPFYLGQGLGLGDLSIGLVMTVGPVISILSGVPSGHAVDLWGSRRAIGTGLAMLAVGAFSLAFLPQAFGIWGYALAIVVLTPGYQLFQAANNAAVMSAVAPDRRGVVAGLLGLSRNLGLILGASAMGAVFAFGAGTGNFEQATPAAIGDGLRLTFIVAGIMAVIALCLSRRANRAAGEASGQAAGSTG
ncbi:MFS transporter [Devosia sp.]|uniref:MFS transporter n=1 Tax=Devosia sp. TaxID=1871048 RepID=UPI002FCA24F2